jgi:hypothetical protein
MSRRSRRLVLFGLPAGLAVLAFAAWLLWPRTAITRENAAKIQQGMTLAEVQAVLGEPADPRGEDSALWPDDVIPAGSRLVVGRFWVGDDVLVVVAFDRGGRVEAVRVLGRARVTLADRLRRWLGL